MFKKEKIKILITIGISISLFCVFLLTSYIESKEISPLLEVTDETKKVEIKEETNKKIILEIEEKKYETEIEKEISVYEFMKQLQQEGKITFKDKIYAGMGKLIEKIKKILQTLFILVLFLTGTENVVYADISLTIRDGNTKIFEGAVPLQVAGTIDLNDNTGTSHSIDAQSVLSLINDADILSADFSISDLEYYSSFGSLYLKCITGTTTGEKCDNWQYTVNNTYPSIGMDQKALSDGENVYLYFGPQYKITLNSNSITTSDTLTATAQEYDYQNDAWMMRTGVTIGLTQPDPENPWTPTEIQTAIVDASSEASFSSIPEGSYNVGIKEDFYFPTETLTVTAAPASDTGSSSS